MTGEQQGVLAPLTQLPRAAQKIPPRMCERELSECRVDLLPILSELSSLVSGSSNLPDILSTLLGIMKRHMRIVRGMVNLFEPDSGLISIHESFGLSEAEVLAMDPQQRLFLEASWAAIEDAGYYPLSFSGRKVGVYVGAIVNDYSAYLHDAHCAISMFHEGTGSSLAGIANRVSYFLNLTGPSQAVDTACCSSLYAVDRAVRDLLAGACDAAPPGRRKATPSAARAAAARRVRVRWRLPSMRLRFLLGNHPTAGPPEPGTRVAAPDGCPYPRRLR